MTESAQKSIREALRAAQAALTPAAGEEAARETRLFFCHVLGWDMARLIAHQNDIFPGECARVLDAMIVRRLAGEPLQYILGEWELMGLTFAVDARALIPRQDTETLVEAALARIRACGYRTALDLCCGTGCIGISLAKLSGVSVMLADISAAALALARENAAKNGVSASFVQTDLFSAIEERFDLIACNPPYLSEADMASLQREVRFEPALALYGGPDGLDFYRRIRAHYAKHLNPGGTLLLEVGAGQAGAVCSMFGNASDVLRDLNGVERVVRICC